MKDELFHRREVELVQAIEKSRAVIAPPSLDEHVNVRKRGSMQLIFSIILLLKHD